MLKKYTFFAVGRKSKEAAEFKHIDVLDLGIRFESKALTPIQQDKLQLGLSEFLKEETVKKVILATLNVMDEENEPINPSTLLKIRKKFSIGPYDRLESIKVEFKSRYRYNLCERILPNIMKTTLVTEFLLLIPLFATANGKSDVDFFSVDPLVAKGLGTTQGFIFTLYNLVNVFAGPGSCYLAQIGVGLDSFFHRCWRFLNGKKGGVGAQEVDPCSNRIKRITLQGIMSLFFLCALFSDFMSNYQQFQAMDEMLDEMEAYSLFPRLFIFYGMSINFYLNQINDPVFAYSLLKYINQRIAIKYTPISPPMWRAEEIDEKITAFPTVQAENRTEEEVRVVVHESIDEKKSNLHAPLLNEGLADEEEPESSCWSRIHYRLFSSRPTTTSYTTTAIKRAMV